MELYYIIWFLCMVIMFMPAHTQKQYRIQLLICLILIFFFGAFRIDFGLDYSAYESIYNSIPKEGKFEYNPQQHAEIGYLYLNYLCPSFRFLLIVSSLFVCISYYFLFDWYISPKYRILAIFLLFLSGNNTIFFMFSGIRNSIAICLLILSLPLIINRKLLLFTLIMFLAASFHTSALIVFPIAYIMGNINKVNKKIAFSLIIIAFILFIMPFEKLLGFSASFISAYFDRYTTYTDNAENIGKGASLLVSLSNIIFILAILWTLFKNNVSSRIQKIILIGSLLFYFPLLGPLDMRLSIYFNAIGIVSVLLTYTYTKNKILRSGILLLFIAYKSYAFFVVFLSNPNFPYTRINNLLFM